MKYWEYPHPDVDATQQKIDAWQAEIHIAGGISKRIGVQLHQTKTQMQMIGSKQLKDLSVQTQANRYVEKSFPLGTTK